MAPNGTNEWAESLTPPTRDWQSARLRQVGQWILIDPIQLDDEVNVRSGRCPGAANRSDHIAFRHRISSRYPRHLGHMSVERLEAIAVVDLDVVAKPAITPTRVLDDSPVRG